MLISIFGIALTLQWMTGNTERNEKIVERQQSTRLHPCPMHPCQLLLLVQHFDITPKFKVLLGHEIPALNDVSEWLLWVDLGDCEVEQD